jgi:hypothetical protein
MRAAELLSQPAAPDRSAGWTVLVLCVLGAAALVAGRRGNAARDLRAAPVEIEPATPLPTPADEP